MQEKMTQKEVHDLGIGCRWYKTLVKMHDYMSRYMLTDEQIRATEQTDAEAALDARGRQAVYHSIQSGLGEEIKRSMTGWSVSMLFMAQDHIRCSATTS